MSRVLIIAWVHGSIGLYFWLRMKAFFRRAAPFLLAAAVLVPTLALLGFYQGGRADLSFFQLFVPHTASAHAHNAQPHSIGEERYLVSLFVDMRGSTELAEARLPFDTVFIVNRFLSAVSQAVIKCGGEPNQFVGDGEMALFGLHSGPQVACRQALRRPR